MNNDSVDRLAKLFLKFPGIGERQARRFAYFILTQQEGYVDSLSRALVSARKNANHCSKCLRIFEGNPGLCQICSDESRDQSSIIVVEKSQDIESFARTDYHGLFFVLGGLIPIVQKDIIQGTNAQKLIDRIQHDSAQGILKETILAFPITPNGEHTDGAVRELLSPIAVNLKITSLGRGLSTGAELEYADPASLEASLKKRE
ncbi:MAG TPA: toprim domain-containing protein [Candidatus Paceibacterota bacterium]|jgi:recombination protein RecR|nr:toprim domain-containing protein [Candidatus Paceibacterota bacterium]